MTNTYVRIKNEVMSGGGTSPQPENPVPLSTTVTGLIVIVGSLVYLGFVNPWIVVFVIGIVVSIFLHEVGHFVTARRSGMKVTQFFLGFGPRLWSFQRGEVEYGVRAFPLGAFVRIVGMSNIDEVPPQDEPRTYRQASYPRRMLVITAGSLMHMVIALVLLSSVYATGGRAEYDARVHILEVTSDSPAAVAGLRPGDVVVSFDGAGYTTDAAYRQAIRDNRPGDVVPMVVERDGRQVELLVTLGTHPLVTGQAYLGMYSTDLDYHRQGILPAVGHSVTDLGEGLWRSVQGVVKVVNPVNLVGHLAGSNDDLETRPTTLVGVSRVSGFIGDQDGLKGVLAVLAGVNVFVGVFNLIPLLPFDGGHAAIATYERIRSRRGRRYMADVSKAVPVTVVVLALVGFLFFTGLYLDIARPL